MNILYLPHTQIDKLQWDALITASEQGQVYALAWYLDVVAPGWDAVVELDEAGKYETVMPVPWQRKLGMRYVQQPLYCQQLGIYTLAASIAGATYRQFWAEVQQRFKYVVGYNFNTGNQLPQQQEQTYTLYLDLGKPYQELQQHYTRDRKMNLKRAQKAGLQLLHSQDIAPLIQFFKDETAKRIYGGVSESAYMLLQNLYRALQERGLAQLYYTLDAGGRKNAGCLFIVWRNKIVYIFNAAAAHGRKLNGRTLILDHIIQKYAGQEFILDFESPDDSEPDIVHFYRSFGPKTMPIPVLKYNRLPKSIKLARELRVRLVKSLKDSIKAFNSCSTRLSCFC
ncbi:GNAT family N-acetyltransferase [uncultured Pontibacter sp.]|uniref:GNAT family N-acetyltransferase n=1 Tax=uncultured Pontibacter sp. TaxID=453356 RepID=UPI0026284EDD|nr:GNAT family N-acetyltransferase [uncultured Pontibacter sp.]